MAEVPGVTPDTIRKVGGSPRKPYQQNSRRGGPPKPANSAIPRQEKFLGACEKLHGFIFDIKGYGMADQFAVTQKKLANHVGTVFPNGTDVKLAVEQLVIPTLLVPTEYDPANATMTEKRVWEKQIDQYVKKMDQLDENIRTLYSIIWGQCTEAMKAKLESMTEFQGASLYNNGVELLKIVKTVCFNFASQKYLPQAIHEAKRRFYQQCQGKYMNAQDYLEQFTNHVDVLTHVGAVIGPDTSIVASLAGMNATTGLPNPATDAHRIEARELYLAVSFLLGADRARYGKLIEDLENNFLQGQHLFPKTINVDLGGNYFPGLQYVYRTEHNPLQAEN